jgi:hypothetical protein
MRSSERRLSFGWLAGTTLAAASLALAVGAVDAEPHGASARAAAATGAAVVSDSLDGQAIVRADAVGPGSSVTGTVTIANHGDATGSFTLAKSNIQDTPGSGGGQLSSRLVLQVEDMATGAQVYEGPLAAMDERALGYMQPGEQRTYRFTVSFPAGDADNALTAARTSVVFDWTARTGEQPERPPTPGPGDGDITPPRLTIDAPRSQRIRGREVTIKVRCDERCFIVDLSRGAKAKPRRRVLPGVATKQTIRLSREDTRTLWERRKRRGWGTVALALTVKDRSQNRTTAGFAIRVPR